MNLFNSGVMPIGGGIVSGMGGYVCAAPSAQSENPSDPTNMPYSDIIDVRAWHFQGRYNNADVTRAVSERRHFDVSASGSTWNWNCSMT